MPNNTERIAKAIARFGICSRRQAEDYIAAGRVKLNGQAITSPAMNVTAEDIIEVDGVPLRQKTAARLFLYHKPRGLVVTHRDPEGRPTVFETLPKDLPRLISVGRLDLNSEGLLLLTNDGELARTLEHPSTALVRRYRVRAFGQMNHHALEKARRGITIDGIRYRPMEIDIERAEQKNIWLQFALQEGKNREIRRICEFLGLKVNRLIRTQYGPYSLGKLALGQVKETPIL